MESSLPRGVGAQPVIELRNVAKRFVVNGTPVPVFDNLSYAVPAGKFLSIVGPSGCGKSTLLKLIAGLEDATSGRVLFDGGVVTGPPKGMVYVFQQYSKSIFPWRTVLGNIEFGLRSRHRMGRREARERCLDYVALMGLNGYEDYYPEQLSGGMQQRVVIARALIGEPEVLLMDEPFSAVDAMTRAILQELLLDLWERLQVTILFVTHDVDEAVFLSTDILSLGRAPGGIRDSVSIPLAYPRDQVTTRESPDFIDLRHRLFASIFDQEKQIQEKQTRAGRLPTARLLREPGLTANRSSP